MGLCITMTRKTKKKLLHFVFLLILQCTKSLSKSPFQEADELINKIKVQQNTLFRQSMLLRFFEEERVRSEGQSGLVQQRLRNIGLRNFHTETHTGIAAAAIHDHANNIRTVGMGEFSAVLNGVYFKTRHNDFRLNQPSKTSTDFHATDEIAFPPVPPEVTKKGTVEEEIDELKEYFTAWRDQNLTKRDYRPYFKPVLCYLEGAWTNVSDSIVESFESDRHFIDANTWMELHEKTMFAAYSGAKSLLENLSLLPTKILQVINGTVPIFAQWNYRILCNPISKDIPLGAFDLVEDLSARMMRQKNIEKHRHSRAARFQLNSTDLLDEIMGEIPGVNNHPGKLTDEGFEKPTLNDDKSPKDASRYHRSYKISHADASGMSTIHRGFHDAFLYTAKTDQSKIASSSFRDCKSEWTAKYKPETCPFKTQRWTYAIPLEIIYLTPLSNWNPYNIKYHGPDNRYSPSHALWTRNGVCSGNKEYNGTDSRRYYRTPTQFFTGSNVDRSRADTTPGTVCVLDKDGKSRKVRASGTYVFLPNIKGVGVLRQRYPIFPVHGEGSSVWSELNALREIAMDDKGKYSYMKWSHNDLRDSQNDIDIKMGISRNVSVTEHTHTVHLTPSEVSQLKGGRGIHKITSTDNGHEHELLVKYKDSLDQYYFETCDGPKSWSCPDKHDRYFFK